MNFANPRLHTGQIYNYYGKSKWNKGLYNFHTMSIFSSVSLLALSRYLHDMAVFCTMMKINPLGRAEYLNCVYRV